MTRKKAKSVTLNVKEHGAAIRKLLKRIGGNGHSIVDPKVLLDAGLPASWVEDQTVGYKSNFSDPKSTLFVAGKPVKGLTGVYTLDAQWRIAEQIGADTSKAASKGGRGSQARCLCEAIHEVLGKE